MSDPTFPQSPVRGLKDIRAAVRHGEATMVRPLHASVISNVASAVAGKHEAPIVSLKKDETSAWENVEQASSLARDAIRLTAAVAGIAAAIWITGEAITLPAITMLAFLPAVVALAKTGEASALLKAPRGDARRVESLRRSAIARRRWLTTVDRAAKLLIRSLSQPHALYESPKFGSKGRVMRRAPINVEHIAHLEEALARARKVETVIADTKHSRQISIAAVVNSGWTEGTVLWRRVLLALGVVAGVNAVVYVLIEQAAPAIIASLLCSLVLAARYGLCAREIRHIESVVRRDLMRMRYPDLMNEVDAIIQNEVDYLIGIYATGFDAVIDLSEDLEGQLRRQLDVAIAYAEQSEKSLSEVLLDLTEIRNASRPHTN